MVYDLRQMTSILSRNSTDFAGIPQNGQRIETADHITAFTGYAKIEYGVQKKRRRIGRTNGEIDPRVPVLQSELLSMRVNAARSALLTCRSFCVGVGGR